MCRGSAALAAVTLESVPLYEGAKQCVAAGIFSTLHPANARLRRAVANHDQARAHPLYPLLFDPQTAGGLLAAVPQPKAAACVAALRGYCAPSAAVIGEVIGAAPSAARADTGYITVWTNTSPASPRRRAA